MKMIYMNTQDKRKKFALEAAEWFAKNPQCNSYTTKEIEQGCLFALRFGLFDDCVVVFKIDDQADVENYCNIIEREGEV